MALYLRLFPSGRVRLCSVTTGGGGSSSDGFSSLAAGFGFGDSEGDGLGFCPRSIVPLINKISKAAGSRKEIWSIVVPLPFNRNLRIGNGCLALGSAENDQ